MKDVRHFDRFLRDVVNLNQTRIAQLEDRVAAVETFVATSNAFRGHFIEARPQGSWAHRTIIRPGAGTNEFDADLVVFLRRIEGWSAQDYVENMYKLFRGDGRYREKVTRCSRCVRLAYANEFHIDIVPCVRDAWLILGDKEFVQNRLTNREERTAPGQYTQWLLDQNDAVGADRLVRVVRLMKYLRDIKRTFSAKSILLTTLLAERVDPFIDDDGDSEFCDVPTALMTVMSRLEEWLAHHERMPTVRNPVLGDEDFNRHWDQEKYANFRAQMMRYAQWVADAYNESDASESVRKWRRIFGDSFAPGLELQAAPDHRTITPAHCRKAPWPVLRGSRIELTAVVEGPNGQPTREYRSGDVIPPGCKLRFSVESEMSAGISFHWQVVNNGRQAADADDLRGEIKAGNAVATESTRYHGMHWIEVFAVDRKRHVCVASSGRFFVAVS